MKLSEIKGKAVVSLAQARKFGVVDDVLVDSAYRKIEAFRMKGEGRGPDYLVASQYVRGIGPDAVTIIGQDALEGPEQAEYLTSLPSLGSILKNRVVTEGGEVLGDVSDVSFDPATGQIESFEYRSNPLESLIGRKHIIEATQVVGVGAGLVTVRQGARPSQAA